MDQKLHKKLQDRKEKGTLRSLSSFDGMIDFISNDYLGLGKLHAGFEKEYKGSTGSRLISGNSHSRESIERQLARFFEAKSGLFFNSGYDANIGIFSAIPQKGDVIIYDELIHASARDGMRLSLAKNYSFRHNDLKDLKRLLERFQDQKMYVAIEGLYSMDGDISPLRSMVTLAKKYNASVILDEAHSAGIFGENGKGLAHALNVCELVDLRLVTFGKAYGAHGAIVLCSEDYRTYLLNFARSFIYTTALPEASFQDALLAVEYTEINALRKKLQENISFFRTTLSSHNFRSEWNSPIQILTIDSIDDLRSLEKTLIDKGLAVKAIYSPTVKQGAECLRICIHAENSREELEKLIQCIDAK